ncbi:hypothetical protein EYF80_016030 [Liparis tanakae]|uniref:Uncharacterized protein n=1 Tax=Liparis tanakae TaxID=230148 RepID=A0A4Z2I741_9TELE|nr:hypothetical protein EYF80_016030 [Liparis tanakae]
MTSDSATLGLSNSLTDTRFRPKASANDTFLRMTCGGSGSESSSVSSSVAEPTGDESFIPPSSCSPFSSLSSSVVFPSCSMGGLCRPSVVCGGLRGSCRPVLPSVWLGGWRRPECPEPGCIDNNMVIHFLTVNVSAV